MTEELKVTAADREAAADALYDRGTPAHQHVLTGEWGIDMAQAFARHRTTTESSLLEALKEAREGLDAGRSLGLHCAEFDHPVILQMDRALTRIDTLIGSNNDG